MMNLELILGAALLAACGLILWLVVTNERLRRANAALMATGSNMYAAGVIHGRREATEEYRASKPWQDGYRAGEHDGYTRARDELIAIAADTDTARQMEGLTQ